MGPCGAEQRELAVQPGVWPAVWNRDGNGQKAGSKVRDQCEKSYLG